MSVSRLTQEELAEIRNSNSNGVPFPVEKKISMETKTFNYETPNNLSNRALKAMKSSGHYFVDKLTNEEISNFFMPFDYISHTRGCDLIGPENNSIIVNCAEISLIFDDFNCIFGIKDSPDIKNKCHFDLNKFIEFCDITRTTPEISISTTIQGKLLSERFPSYPEIKHSFDEKNLNNAKKNLLSPEMRSALSTSTLLQQKSIDDMYDLKTSGSFNNGMQKILK